MRPRYTVALCSIVFTIFSLAIPATASRRLTTRASSDYGSGTGSIANWLLAGPSTSIIGGISVMTETVCPSPDGGVDQTTTSLCSGSWVFLYQVPSGPNNLALTFSALTKFAFNAAGASPTFGVLICNPNEPSTMLCTNLSNSAAGALDLDFEAEGGNLIITVPSFPAAADTLTFYIAENVVEPSSVELLNPLSAPLMTVGGAILSPPTMAFGSQEAGTSSSPQTMTFTNSADFSTALDLSNIATSNNFSTSGMCPSVTSGSSCAFLLSFSPATTGNLSGTFTVLDNSPLATETATLNGLASTPGVTISPSNLFFGSQQVGTSSAAQVVTITNAATNAQPLSVTAITSPADPLTGQPDFVDASDTCIGNPIQPGNSCQANITFSPSSSTSSSGTTTTISGSISSTMVITDSSVDGSHTVQVTGTANEAGVASTSVPSLAFGSQPNGTTSAVQTVTLSTPATSAINIVDTNVTGGFTLQTDQCGTIGSITAGSPCTESVTFNPTQVGQYTGSLTIADDTMGATVVVPLTGTGSDFLLAANPSSQNVTQGQSTSYTLTLTPEGGFTGTVQFSCSGSPSESTCPAPNSVMLDGVHTSQVTFTVTTTAPSEGMLLPYQVTIGATAGTVLNTLPFLATGVLMLGLRRNRKNIGRLVGLITVLSVAFCLSCGGGSSTPPPPTNPGTPVGSYTLMLTASASGGTPSHTVDVALDVAQN